LVEVNSKPKDGSPQLRAFQESSAVPVDKNTDLTRMPSQLFAKPEDIKPQSEEASTKQTEEVGKLLSAGFQLEVEFTLGNLISSVSLFSSRYLHMN
jgi:hypothetical protein